MTNKKEPIEMYLDGEITVEEYICLIDEQIEEQLKDSPIRQAAKKVERIKKEMERYKKREIPKKITWSWIKWWRKAEKEADNTDDLLTDLHREEED